MQHFSTRERLGVGAAATIILMLGLGGWAYSRVGGDSAPSKPAFAPVGANGAPASIEIAASGVGTALAPRGKASPASVARQAGASAVLVVHVTGEVRNPGVYKFKDGDRIADAVHAAGGFKDHADQEALNLADTLRDADQICVPLLVKLIGPTDSAESRSSVIGYSPAPTMRQRRLHPLIVHGASAAEVAPAPVVIAAADSDTAPEAASAPFVPPVVMQRVPGRVLGRPAAPQYSAADETADEAAGTDSTIPPTDSAFPADMQAGRLSLGKKGKSAGARSASKGGKSGGKSAKFKNPGDGVVHLNSASAAQLEQLPGVGPAMSARIVEYRAQIGKFTDVSQIQDVKGIGAKKFAKMQPFLAL